MTVHEYIILYYIILYYIILYYIILFLTCSYLDNTTGTTHLKIRNCKVNFLQILCVWRGYQQEYVATLTTVRMCWRRVRLKCDGTQWRTGGEVKGKLANGVGSQYSSHYFGTWCIQHYYRSCAHLGCQQSTELTPPRRFKWTRPFRRKTKSGFCACAITFQTHYTFVSSAPDLKKTISSFGRFPGFSRLSFC